MPKYWLMKSEPQTFSIDDLRLAPNQTEPWDGIRNYQARNFMRDEMAVGDPVLFYHSSCPQPGIVGLAEVASKPYPDPTAFDRKSKYFDEKSDRDHPRWVLVEVRFKEAFDKPLLLSTIKADKTLSQMLVAQRGQRLSIQPVDKPHFERAVKLARGA